MLTLLFSANYPGAHAPFWEFFGASLEHLVPALCFLTFVVGEPEAKFSVSMRWRSPV
jgi:thiosulfate dehydrogenase [quinone] large subunit